MLCEHQGQKDTCPYQAMKFHARWEDLPGDVCERDGTFKFSMNAAEASYDSVTPGGRVSCAHRQVDRALPVFSWLVTVG